MPLVPHLFPIGSAAECHAEPHLSHYERHTYTVNGVPLTVGSRIGESVGWDAKPVISNPVPWDVADDNRRARLKAAVEAACTSLWGPGSLRYGNSEELEWR